MAITASAFGMSLAVSVVPSSGSRAMSTAGAVAGADLLADVEHRRLVALALADDHDALDVEQVELRAHRVDRGLVGGLLVAAADQLRRRDRRGLGDPGEAQRQHAVGEDVSSDIGIPALVAIRAAASRRPAPAGQASGRAGRPLYWLTSTCRIDPSKANGRRSA